MPRKQGPKMSLFLDLKNAGQTCCCRSVEGWRGRKRSFWSSLDVGAPDRFEYHEQEPKNLNPILKTLNPESPRP